MWLVRTTTGHLPPHKNVGAVSSFLSLFSCGEKSPSSWLASCQSTPSLDPFNPSIIRRDKRPKCVSTICTNGFNFANERTAEKNTVAKMKSRLLNLHFSRCQWHGLLPAPFTIWLNRCLNSSCYLSYKVSGRTHSHTSLFAWKVKQLREPRDCYYVTATIDEVISIELDSWCVLSWILHHHLSVRSAIFKIPFSFIVLQCWNIFFFLKIVLLNRALPFPSFFQ